MNASKENEMEWWGYSKEHGWVVLDRSIPSNGPGLKGDLLFFRCRDATTYSEKRKSWTPPAYRFAQNYIRELASPGSAEAADRLASLKALWSDGQRQEQLEHRENEERAEALRVEQAIEEEKEQKKAVREKNKLIAGADKKAVLDLIRSAG